MRSKLSNLSASLLSPRLIALLLAFALVGGRLYFWVTETLRPMNVAIERVSRHEERINRANEQARRTIANLGIDKIEEAIEAYNQQARHVARLVPTYKERSSPLATLTSTARTYGIRVEQMTPVHERIQGDFRAEGYSLSVVGGYHDVGGFFAALLSEPRITQIDKVKLTAIAVPPANFPKPSAAIPEITELSGGTWAVRATFNYLAYSWADTTFSR